MDREEQAPWDDIVTHLGAERLARELEEADDRDRELEVMRMIDRDAEGEAGDVAGDAQDPMPPDPPQTEFSHGGRYYRVTATATQYPVLEIRSRRDGGRWTEVDPAEDMALYDAFVAAAESISAMDAPNRELISLEGPDRVPVAQFLPGGSP